MPSVLGGSRAKEGWVSTDADQGVECHSGGMRVRLAAPRSIRDSTTAAIEQDRTGVRV